MIEMTLMHPFYKPMLAHPIGDDDALMRSPHHVAEPKVDGQRGQIHVACGRAVACYSRLGNDVLATSGMRWLTAVPWPFDAAVLDCELYAGTGLNTTGPAVQAERAGEGKGMAVALFDVLAEGATLVVGESWRERRARLERLVRGLGDPRIQLTVVHQDPEALWSAWTAIGGEGIMLKHRESCFAPGTLVCGWDLRWRPIGELSLGDQILAFSEKGRTAGARRTWKPSTVTRRWERRAEAWRVTLEDGREIIVTPDHPVLAAGRDRKERRGSRKWRTVAEIIRNRRHDQRGLGFCRALTPWPDESSFDAGCISGMFEAEGSVSVVGTNQPKRATRLTYCQNKGPVLDRMCELLARHGFSWSLYSKGPEARDKCKTVALKGGIKTVMELLGRFRARRLTDRLMDALKTRPVGFQTDVVRPVSWESLGEQTVVGIETSSHTYLADGLAVHNCYQIGKRSWYWRKVKVTTTVDVVITGLNEKPSYDPRGGYRTGEVALAYGFYDRRSGGLLTVGHGIRVGSRAELSKLIGRVAEMRCAAVMPSGALRHGQFNRWREDKRPEDCTPPEQMAVKGGAR